MRVDHEKSLGKGPCLSRLRLKWLAGLPQLHQLANWLECRLECRLVQVRGKCATGTFTTSIILYLPLLVTAPPTNQQTDLYPYTSSYKITPII